MIALLNIEYATARGLLMATRFIHQIGNAQFETYVVIRLEYGSISIVRQANSVGLILQMLKNELVREASVAMATAS